MPYEIRRCETPESIRLEGVQSPPFGPGFSHDELGKAKRLVVTGSTFSDPGPDWTLFELYDEAGKVFAKRKINGY